jgi:Tfp pilus assembly protein PilF
MNHRARWGLLAVFSSVFLTIASAQTEKVVVDGYVRDNLTQQPVPAARVELRTSSGDPVGLEVLSGSSGEFHLAALETGSYSLSVEHSGYQVANVPIGNLTQSNLVVSLSRITQSGSPSASRPVSLHELTVPAKAQASFEKGAAELAKGDPDYQHAISQFRRAIKESPTFYEAYAEMSIAQFRMGDSRAAEESLRKSAELSENHYAKALALLSELLNSQNRFAEAEAAARQAIAADELSARGHLQLARALSGLRRPAEAEASAKRAQELEPANPLISLVLGNIHIQKHDLAAAVHDFDAYLSRVPRGAQSDLVRKSRDQAQRVLEAQHVAAGMQGP